MKLQKLQILARQPGPHGQGDAVARTDVGVAGGAEGSCVAAGGEKHGLGLDEVEAAVYHVPGQDPAGLSLVHDEFQHQKLVEKPYLMPQAFLEQGVQHGVAGAVGRRAGAAHRGLAEVLGVAAEGPLVDAAVVQARKGKPHMLQLDDHLGGHAAHELDGVLVAQPVGALDRVPHVEMPVVRLHVAQGCADAALGAYRVASGGKHLADDGGVHLAAGLQGGPQPGAAGAHHQGAHPVHGDFFIYSHGRNISFSRAFPETGTARPSGLPLWPGPLFAAGGASAVRRS